MGRRSQSPQAHVSKTAWWAKWRDRVLTLLKKVIDGPIKRLCANAVRALRHMVHGLIQKTIDILLPYLRDEDKAWVLRQGPFVGFYIWYGLGIYFVDDSDRPCYIVPSYVVAAVLAWLLLAWWVLKWKKKFQHSQTNRSWRDELGASAWNSFMGLTGVGAVTFISQMSLIGVYRPSGPIFWLICFACVSSVVATVGSYFFVGYPGMANLEILDRWLQREKASGRFPRPLPTGLKASLEAELAALRTILSGLVTLYVVAILGVLLSLDTIPDLLNMEESQGFKDVPFRAKLWFLSGAALLLAGCHWSITGPVHGQHYRIARWLRHLDGL